RPRLGRSAYGWSVRTMRSPWALAHGALRRRPLFRKAVDRHPYTLSLTELVQLTKMGWARSLRSRPGGPDSSVDLFLGARTWRHPLEAFVPFRACGRWKGRNRT